MQLPLPYLTQNHPVSTREVSLPRMTLRSRGGLESVLTNSMPGKVTRQGLITRSLGLQIVLIGC